MTGGALLFPSLLLGGLVCSLEITADNYKQRWIILTKNHRPNKPKIVCCFIIIIIIFCIHLYKNRTDFRRRGRLVH